MDPALLLENPARRRGEWLLLGYAPLWMGVIAVVTLTRCFTHWGEAGHMVLGLGLWLPLCLLPLVTERGQPLAERYLTKVVLYLTLLSLVQNYFGARLFFRGLGMQYHFNVQIIWNGTPLFLYFTTVAYFSTYFVLLQVATRTFARRFPAASPAVRWLVLVVLSYAVAFAETLLMANEWLHDVFSYANKAQALRVGSLCYGTLFLISFPPFGRIDADPTRPTSLRRVVWDALAANMLILLCYEVYLGTLLR